MERHFVGMAKAFVYYRSLKKVRSTPVHYVHGSVARPVDGIFIVQLNCPVVGWPSTQSSAANVGLARAWRRHLQAPSMCRPNGLLWPKPNGNYIMRANPIQATRRFTRLTNAFSKKVENHAHSVALFAMYYNFVRIHKTLRTTPAMAAGVTSRLWEIDDIVNVLEAWEANQ
jgi:hypothetical protein